MHGHRAMYAPASGIASPAPDAGSNVAKYLLDGEGDAVTVLVGAALAADVPEADAPRDNVDVGVNEVGGVRVAVCDRVAVCENEATAPDTVSRWLNHAQ